MGEQLEEVTSHQYLGVHIENNLKWNRQTKHVSEKQLKFSTSSEGTFITVPSQ